MNYQDKIKEKLIYLYGEKTGKKTYERLLNILENYKKFIPNIKFKLSHKDSVLITYGDSFKEKGIAPLKTLYKFLNTYLNKTISIVHILPFFPYSSDDGFSVIDYKRVNPELGNWEDIEKISKKFKLMFDAVINHISAKSKEFQGFLKGDEKYKGFFIEVDENTDISKVFRPRALPLITEFKTENGIKRVWTTFSADQIDLNYKNPEVLLYIIDVLLYYVQKGASVIRLDAIAYLWKEPGTTCIHLPQTHEVVKLFRTIFDWIAPHVKIITETNVPHKENISYFGNGNDEAHMVYNFALPPLTAHTILTGNVTALSKWAKTLSTPSENTYFYNFTASHDGIGVLPAKGLISDDEINNLIETTIAHGGRVSYKSNPDGSKSPYELNIVYFDLLNNPESKEPIELQVNRFVASQVICMVLKGIPAFYYHSVVGSRNYYEGVAKTGMARSINREKLDYNKIKEELNTKGNIRNLVYTKLTELLNIRKGSKAFDPHGEQNILDIDKRIFAVERISPDGKEKVLTLLNVSDKPITIPVVGDYKKDLITDRIFINQITINQYESLWLQQYPQS